MNQNSATNSDNGESENRDEIDVDNVIQEDFHTWVSRTGGHNGGWSAEDHLYMVTLTHRHANWRRLPDRFLEEIWSGVRAVSTREAVRRHVLWYAEYCVRRDRQRQTIGQWRERRAAAKVEERRNSATSMKLHKTNKSGWLHKNKEKLRKLEEWKRLKTVKKEIEEAEELLRVAEKKSKIEQRMERRNTQIKRYLKVREEKKKVQQRREEEEKRIKELERKHRREMNRMVLSQYHEKDMERIQWKVKQKADEQVTFSSFSSCLMMYKLLSFFVLKGQTRGAEKASAGETAEASPGAAGAGHGPQEHTGQRQQGAGRGRQQGGQAADQPRARGGGGVQHIQELPTAEVTGLRRPVPPPQPAQAVNTRMENSGVT